MTKFDFICIGNLNFDIIFRTDRLPDPHEKMQVADTIFGFGGSASNTACWLGSLGCKVGFLGAVGNDLVGKMAIQDLRKYSVDTQGITFSPDFPSGVAVIIAEGIEKRMMKNSGANSDKHLNLIYLTNTKHIHFSSNREEFLQEAIPWAKKADIPMSFDPGEMTCLDLMNEVNYIFINFDEFSRLTNTDNLQKGLDNNFDKPILFITGPRGGCWIAECIDGNYSTFWVPPFPNVIVNQTVGAGDSFNAGVLFGLYSKLNLRDSAKLGVGCQTLCVMGKNSRSSIVSLPELRQFMDSVDNGTIDWE